MAECAPDGGRSDAPDDDPTLEAVTTTVEDLRADLGRLPTRAEYTDADHPFSLERTLAVTDDAASWGEVVRHVVGEDEYYNPDSGARAFTLATAALDRLDVDDAVRDRCLAVLGAYLPAYGRRPLVDVVTDVIRAVCHDTETARPLSAVEDAVAAAVEAEALDLEKRPSGGAEWMAVVRATDATYNPLTTEHYLDYVADRVSLPSPVVEHARTVATEHDLDSGGKNPAGGAAGLLQAVSQVSGSVYDRPTLADAAAVTVQSVGQRAAEVRETVDRSALRVPGRRFVPGADAHEALSAAAVERARAVADALDDDPLSRPVQRDGETLEGDTRPAFHAAAAVVEVGAANDLGLAPSEVDDAVPANRSVADNYGGDPGLDLDLDVSGE